MRRAFVIVAASAAAIVLAVAITLLLEEGPAAPASSGHSPTAETTLPQRARSTPSPDYVPAPIRWEARPPQPPGPMVTSAPPDDADQAAGPIPRVVGGPGISPGPVLQGRMEREDPPAKPVPAPSGPQWRTFTQVVVIGAGLINLGGRKVALAGLTVPQSGTQCRPAAGDQTFDCAFLSMQALRQRIRARGIECRLDTLETIGAEPAVCRIGTTDLGGWLIEQGWAAAGDGAPDEYRAAEHSARCAGSGVWLAAARPDDCPSR